MNVGLGPTALHQHSFPDLATPYFCRLSSGAMTKVSKGLLLSVTVFLDVLEFLSDPIVIAGGLLLSAYYVEMQILNVGTRY